MVVCDSLSRARPVHSLDSAESSPNENDPYFPFVPEPANEILLPNGSSLQEVICTEQSNQLNSVNHILLPPTSLSMQPDIDSAYEGDTDLPKVKNVDNRYKSTGRGKIKRKIPKQSRRLATKSHISKGISENENECGKPMVVHNSDATNYEKRDSTQNDKEILLQHLTERNEQSENNISTASAYSDDRTSLDELPSTNRSIENVDLFKSFDFSPEKISGLQRQDCELRYLIQYLESNDLPKSQKRARKLLLQSADYCMIDGLLFHCRVPKSQRSNNMNQYQLVVPEIMIKTVLGLYHDSPMGGHSGIQDTLDRVKEHYFFPRMSQLVTDYVRSCPDCQKRKQTKVHTKSGVTAYNTPSGAISGLAN